MNYLEITLLLLVVCAVLGFLIVQLIDKYAPYDQFDEEQARKDVEELLRHANQPPTRKRAF